jgi:Ribonuclease G/E
MDHHFKTPSVTNEEDIRRVNSLHKDLKNILDAELKAGNTIFKTSEGDPLKTSILVLLSKPFQKIYTIGEAEYRGVNNPYYWKGEYRVPKHDHTLACKF